ncbi:LppX_LprAFG lipoprotein [Streptomyces sp. APSN-46.1]|uniref:LppX_LprAFG lipoprotein n=1 Tax=Streptomyces sp. APSN-46.1 TaxID=2929049 RepID=UPI001FB43989|nr:LppX_LprAFG lipoprotein [Streptomyces sp. APSN-46.1]MCJ1679374.1 LppX_LprAFG lipoprotein [Streptomyces sp. APSN-46.1]
MLANRKKTVGAALAAVLLVGGATACENGDTKKDTGKAAASASASASAPAGKGAAEVTPVALLESTRKTSEEITSLRYTMSGTTPDGAVAGDVSMSLKPALAMQMKMTSPDSPGETAEIRLIDGAMYIGAEGKWLKFDLKSLDPKAAEQLDAAGKGTQNAENPGDKANALLQSKDVKLVGEETIDGQKTKHLAGTLTLDQMKTATASEDQAAKDRREKTLKDLEKQGITTMTVDMWIDESNHTKQVRTRGQGTKGATDMTIKFTDYNKPVSVTAPPADQVVDLAEMMKGSGEGSA